MNGARRDGIDRKMFVVVEKILVGDERLPKDWPVNGTTGYDFMNQLNGLFVDERARRRFMDLYARFTGRAQSYPDVVATCKKLIMLVGLASELRVLAIHLDRISEQHRWSRDFTLESLRFALREVIAYFPVYRTYIRADDPVVSDADRAAVTTAIREAKRHNPATDESIFDFIASVLLLQDPDGLTPEQIRDRRQFVMRFQQLTSPVMAKGMEDTSFYRYFPLASLNEVGGDPHRFGGSAKIFHERNRERLERWPHTLLATTTHDTKRSEDVRARINVLSEMPVKWYRSIRRWQAWNKDKKTVNDGRAMPDDNEEYLLYQTIVGTWPLEKMNSEQRKDYTGRIESYLLKAVKEAKIHTSWINPNKAYEEAVTNFVRAVLAPSSDNRFLKDLEDFQDAVAMPGLMNSLSQTLLKLTSPGVPDFYQGTELWDFSLVDPDNRRPVDYAARRKILGAIQRGAGDPLSLCSSLIARPKDGAIKLYIIKQSLAFRGRETALFDSGGYTPAQAEGPRRNNVIGFTRAVGNKAAVALAARFFMDLSLNENNQITPESWQGSSLVLRGPLASAQFRDVFTGRVFRPKGSGGRATIPLASIFRVLPVALLEKTT
ncbi:MAG: malto-oligosyltrehalose synthase [Elusimicrobia bacterium]|nr:malto-oligosyltrehalose synthase [Elusimicrobiota bacterium]